MAKVHERAQRIERAETEEEAWALLLQTQEDLREAQRVQREIQQQMTELEAAAAELKAGVGRAR